MGASQSFGAGLSRECQTQCVARQARARIDKSASSITPATRGPGGQEQILEVGILAAATVPEVSDADRPADDRRCGA